MPIYQTAHYRVKASAVDKVTAAIADFVEYLAKNEPRSTMYSPEVVNGPVVFTDYQQIASNRT